MSARALSGTRTEPSAQQTLLHERAETYSSGWAHGCRSLCRRDESGGGSRCRPCRTACRSCVPMRPPPPGAARAPLRRRRRSGERRSGGREEHSFFRGGRRSLGHLEHFLCRSWRLGTRKRAHTRARRSWAFTSRLQRDIYNAADLTATRRTPELESTLFRPDFVAEMPLLLGTDPQPRGVRETRLTVRARTR